jgi:ankyrin repeat protein
LPNIGRSFRKKPNGGRKRDGPSGLNEMSNPKKAFAILGIAFLLLFAWVFWYIAIYDFDIAHAASTGNVKEVARLLDRNPDLLESRADGWTPLNWAATNGRAEVVQLLLDRGADIDAENEWGKTSLELAEEKGHNEVVELLAQRGAKKTE